MNAAAPSLDARSGLAAAAPDHGRLNPWCFIVVPVAQRHRLAEVFVQAPRDGEEAVCCIDLGTLSRRKAPTHVGPPPARFVSELPPG